jgi:hypothetical protein
MISTRSVAPAVSDLPCLEEVRELARTVASASERLRAVVEELKVERTRAVGDLRRAVLNLGHACPDDRRAEVARVLYWCHTEVPITDITVAFGFHDQASLLVAVGRVNSGAVCEHCGEPLLASSRRRLAELEKLGSRGPARYGPRPLCPRCEERHERAIFAEPPDDLYDDAPDAWGEDTTRYGAWLS